MVLKRPMRSDMYPERDRPSAEPLKILISEDQAAHDQRSQISQYLRIQNCNNIEASLAAEALQQSISGNQSERPKKHEFKACNMSAPPLS
jgi:PleD family two-component response regulator